MEILDNIKEKPDVTALLMVLKDHYYSILIDLQTNLKNNVFMLYSVFASHYCFQALQRTIEFEEELAEKFGGGSAKSQYQDAGQETQEVDEEKRKTQLVSDIRKKYEKKLAIQSSPGAEPV